MKYELECNECGLIQKSNEWIPLTPCDIHRERLNPEDQLSGNSGQLICESPNIANK